MKTVTRESPPVNGAHHPPAIDPTRYRMRGGAYAGRLLTELPREALEYVASRNWHPEVQEYARRLLAETEPPPTPPELLTPGAIKVTRGKYSGRTLAQCPPDFLMWLATTSTCPVYRQAAAELLGLSHEETDGSADSPPDAEAAAAVLPRIAWEWWVAMLGEFAESELDLPVIERGLQKLKEIIGRHTRREWPAEGGQG